MSLESRDPVPDKHSLSSLWTARLLRLRPLHGPRPTGQRVRDPLEVPRWALTLGLLLFMLLFLAMLAFFFAPAPAHGSTSDGINFDRPSKDWYQGPVRYIITKQEVKAYKALENEAERATFIDWFWQRRDIKPDTPDNEFRERFEQRTYEATRKFGATTTPGWKTDMGKIYILVGPPDEIISDLMAQSHRGMVSWTYRKPPFPELPPNTVVGFAKDVSGEFRLSTSPTLDSDVARGIRFSKNPMDINQRMVLPGHDPFLLDAGVSLSQGEMETRIIYGRMQQLPPREEELFQAFVNTKESYGSVIPMEVRLDYYRGEGLTYTTVTVGIRSSSVQFRARGGREVPDVGVFGKLVSRTNPDESYPLASDSSFAENMSNSDAGANDLLLFQAAGGFKPGLYRAILGVEDHVSKKISSTSREIEIPDLSTPAFGLSSITLAASLEPTDYATTTAKPFQIGKFRLAPQPDATFTKDGELNVYFQVYNPAIDAATGKPRLDVLYTFTARAQDGSTQDLGTYQVKGSTAQVQGYAVPLKKWPEGEFGLKVTVLDQVSKVPVSKETTFTIKP